MRKEKVAVLIVFIGIDGKFCRLSSALGTNGLRLRILL